MTTNFVYYNYCYDDHYTVYTGHYNVGEGCGVEMNLSNTNCWWNVIKNIRFSFNR